MRACSVSDLARDLAHHAEAVCRHYLSAGRRQGRYWLVGDIDNNPGRSLFVRLSGSDRVGRWQDAATGQHGDLLDLIRLACGLINMGDAATEARRFLGLLQTELGRPARHVGWQSGKSNDSRPGGASDAAARLFRTCGPIAGTAAEAYLKARGITMLQAHAALRFHPHLAYRPDRSRPAVGWPALVAAVTDHDGIVTGVQRTWLSRDARSKAPVATPRRALGRLAGHAVRFGTTTDVMLAGEGVETVLSVVCALPGMPAAAALSAANLGALQLPPALRRLYVARDNDMAGRSAAARLTVRAEAVGIATILLTPRLGDFNDDLLAFGADDLGRTLRVRLAPEDVARSMA